MRLVAAALLALLVALPAPHAAAQLQPFREASAEPRVSAKAMQHIMSRHGADSPAQDAGKYARGTTPEMIRALIVEAVRRGTPHPDSNGRSATLYDHSFPEAIGTTADGAPTRRIRVVVGRDGDVLTAYPR